VENLGERCAALEEEPARKHIDRKELLQDPTHPKVLFDYGFRQAFAGRCFSEDLSALDRAHPGNPVQAAFSAIRFATS